MARRTADAVATVPGTVSKLLWHFTGGPKWNNRELTQNDRPKSPRLAYEALVSILKSRELRLGSYAEIARVTLPMRRRYDTKTRRSVEQKNVCIAVKSAPMCCLADIPIAHLAYHSNRYGKMAIGFHRDAVVNSEFNPVLYTLDDMGVIRSLYSGLNHMDTVDAATISMSAHEIESCADGLNDDIAAEISSTAQVLGAEADDITEAIGASRESFQRLLAFVKTFDRNQFQTVYCEREWRSLKPFRFIQDDIAMIVLPKALGRTNYFRRFVGTAFARALPRSIPIVPWEDLVEH
jgi:abortive phage resistance protein AbiGi (putative antitoxin)